MILTWIHFHFLLLRCDLNMDALFFLKCKFSVFHANLVFLFALDRCTHFCEIISINHFLCHFEFSKYLNFFSKYSSTTDYNDWIHGHDDVIKWNSNWLPTILYAYEMFLLWAHWFIAFIPSNRIKWMLKCLKRFYYTMFLCRTWVRSFLEVSGLEQKTKTDIRMPWIL